MQTTQASLWLRPITAPHGQAGSCAHRQPDNARLATQHPRPGKAAIVYRCAANPTACDQEHHGDRGHQDVDIEETLLRGDPLAPVVTARACYTPLPAGSACTHRVPGPVPFGRGRLRRSDPPRPGTDRRPGTARPMQAFDQPTSCLQSRFERAGDEAAGWTGEVTDAAALTVGVRWGPFEANAHGTVVAWPPRTDRAGTWQLRDHLARRVLPVPGDDLPRWQAAKAARQVELTSGL
jgi:hypothetical protein